jgi:hypothetical protein
MAERGLNHKEVIYMAFTFQIKRKTTTTQPGSSNLAEAELGLMMTGTGNQGSRLFLGMGSTNTPKEITFVGHTHDAGDIVTGTLGLGRGGTGFSTYTKGDLIYASGSNELSKLAIGSEGHVLTVGASSTVGWSSLSSTLDGASLNEITVTSVGTASTDIPLTINAANNTSANLQTWKVNGVEKAFMNFQGDFYPGDVYTKQVMPNGEDSLLLKDGTDQSSIELFDDNITFTTGGSKFIFGTLTNTQTSILEAMQSSSGNDQAGRNLEIKSGAGTGNGTLSKIILKTPFLESSQSNSYQLQYRDTLTIETSKVTVDTGLDVGGSASIGSQLSVNGNIFLTSNSQWVIGVGFRTGTNVPGYNLPFYSGLGTGTGATSKFEFYTPVGVASGTDNHTTQKSFEITSTGINVLGPSAQIKGKEIYVEDRITIGDAIGHDVPYIQWGGSSENLRLKMADYANENPIYFDFSDGIPKILMDVGSKLSVGSLSIPADTNFYASGTSRLDGFTEVNGNLFLKSNTTDWSIGVSAKTGTNVSGNNLPLYSALGTGTGTPSSIEFYTPNTVASGSTPQTFSRRLQIDNNGIIVSGKATINGDLIVNGTTTTINSTQQTIDDPILTLGGDTSTVETSKDRGIEAKYNGTTLTITNYIGNGTTTVTGTVASTTGFAAGDIITIAGAIGTQQVKLNGTWKIASVPNATTFTFVVESSITAGTLTSGLGTTIKSKNAFFGLDQSTGKFTFIPQSNNTSEVFTGTKGTIDANIEWNDVLSKPTTFAPSAHSITSHSATAWRMFYSNSSTVQELALGNANQYLKSTGTGANPTFATIAYSELSGLPTLITAFTGLSDTPASYTSAAGKLVAVNSTPNGLEFIDSLDCGTW